MGPEEAVKLHDDLLAGMPEGARHDSDICPVCVDKATRVEPTTSRNPSRRKGGPDVSDSSQQSPDEHGGRDTKTMSENDMISKETHEALLEKALKDATSATEGALQRKTEEASQLKDENERLSTESTDLKAENERLNKELDDAQVSLKASKDEVARLEGEIETAKAEAARAEIASKRVEQVKNLGLFEDDYVAEKARAWADMSDEAWAERLDEWAKLKPATSGEPRKTDSASAMSGTSEDLTKDHSDSASKKTPARRAALGLS